MIKIFYIVPQDFDSIDSPNLFNISGDPNEPITLKMIKEQFPLPGVYTFRLGFRHKSRVYWMDIDDEAEALPLMENGEYLFKVTRVFAAVGSSKMGSISSGEERPAAATSMVNVSKKSSVLDDSFFL